MLARLTPIHRLSLARLVSLTGGEAAYIALVALVYDRTDSSLWVSAALLSMIGVAGVCAPFAGMLGDRFDRRRVLIASDVLAAALFLAIALVDAPWQLVILAGLAAAAESPFIPTSSAAVPNPSTTRPTCRAPTRSSPPAAPSACSAARSPAACSSPPSARRRPSWPTRRPSSSPPRS
jgi:MFS family permease